MFLHENLLFLTFSDSALKILNVKFTVSKPEIIYFDQHTFPSGVVFDDKILDLNRFKEEVREFLVSVKSNLNSRQIVFCLNEQEVFLNRFVESGNGDLRNQIGKFLESRLPYQLNEATVRFRKTANQISQLISTKHQLIKDLVSIFDNTDFSLKRIEPLPLPCLDLLAEVSDPYIFVLSEDQTLQFALVVDQTIVFSASLKLLKNLGESQKQVAKTVKELITNGFENNEIKTVNPRSVFIVGEGADLIKAALTEEKFGVTVINLLDKFTVSNSSDINFYTKALLTASATKEKLSFSGTDVSGVSETQRQARLSFSLKKIIFLTSFLILTLVLVFGVWFFNKKDLKVGSVPKNSTKETVKVSTESSETKIDETKTEATQKPTIIQKNELKIQVLNGTNTKGLASQTKDFLVNNGYTVEAIGNAENQNFDQTIVKFKTSKESALVDLTTVLSERYSVIRGDHLAEDGQFDFIIIVGRK